MSLVHYLQRQATPVRYALDLPPHQAQAQALNNWFRASIAAQPKLLNTMLPQLSPHLQPDLFNLEHDDLAHVLHLLAHSQHPRDVQHLLNQLDFRKAMGGWNPRHQAYLPGTPAARMGDEAGRKSIGLLFGAPLQPHRFVDPGGLNDRMAMLPIAHHAALAGLGNLGGMAGLQLHSLMYHLLGDPNRGLATAIQQNMRARNDAANFYHTNLKQLDLDPETTEPHEHYVGH